MDIKKQLSVLLGKVIEMSNALNSLEIEIENLIDELEDYEIDEDLNDEEEEDEKDND